MSSRLVTASKAHDPEVHSILIGMESVCSSPLAVAGVEELSPFVDVMPAGLQQASS
jgi:hypothetical protein